MKNMSFFLTTAQVREGTKTVTRRLGWDFLQPGDRACAVVKGQGIPKGGSIERIRIIECVSNRAEPLWRMLLDPDYGKQEAVKEGFPEMDGLEFVEMLIKHHTSKRKVVDRNTAPNRIEFRYVDEARSNCCAAAVRVGGRPRGESTRWHECVKCGHACDLL